MTSPHAFYHILRLYSAVSVRLEDCLQAEQVTAGHYTVLSMLDGLEPTSAAELARSLDITAQSMSQIIHALELKGLIERCVSPTHGRRIDIRRTAEGRKVLASCHDLVTRAEHDFLEPLSTAEQAVFSKMMVRLRIAQRSPKVSKTASPPPSATNRRAANKA